MRRFTHDRYYWLETGMNNWIIGKCWIDCNGNVFFMVTGLSVLYTPSDFLCFVAIKSKV